MKNYWICKHVANSNLISEMGEYPVEIATSSRILATSDYVANLREQCATFFCIVPYVCVYVCMYVCMYVCRYVRTYVRTYVHMYVCMYVQKGFGRSHEVNNDLFILILYLFDLPGNTVNYVVFITIRDFLCFKSSNQ